MGLTRSRILVFSSVIALLYGLALPASAATYDGTTKEVFHGFLMVLADDCTNHSLVESSTVSRSALDGWGNRKLRVHVVSETRRDLEYAIELSPSLQNKRVTCREKVISHDHIIGTLQNWSVGNAIGSFDLVDARGARYAFSFLTRDLQKTAINLKWTTGRARVEYEVKDSPQGPNREIISITSI